jgi:hypothetical protein
MGLYDVGQNFTPGTGTSFNARGAYNFKPAEGSSNILGGGMQMAGSGAWSSEMDKAKQLFDSSGYKNATAAEQAVLRGYLPTAGSSDTQSLLDLAKYQMSPEYQNTQRQAALDFYKQQGDQQMKYNLVNRGLTALQTGLERGLTKYQDPYTIANLMANGYAEGARASSGLAQIGAGIPSRQYYNV